jgi:hypothetical protein
MEVRGDDGQIADIRAAEKRETTADDIEDLKHVNIDENKNIGTRVFIQQKTIHDLALY